MASNRFGTHFSVTTFGESHGECVGVVIDGCPAGLPLDLSEIQSELDRRKPGQSKYTSPRNEPDQAKIVSGLFEGKTTGAPICILVANSDSDPSKYEPIKEILRPGHANYTYLEKYGCFDYRGGGRASARETVCRVAAGAIAKKLIAPMEVYSQVTEVGGESDPEGMARILDEAIQEGDSVGAIITTIVTSIPVGLGDPVYDKLGARIASAVLSIPATKGIEFGEGFEAARMKGSEHNDAFVSSRQKGIHLSSNHHGGTLGGISTGSPLLFRVAFKPTSSIKKGQNSVDLSGNRKKFILPEGSRHDPCVALRAPPIVESMTAIVLADALLKNQSVRLDRIVKKTNASCLKK